jgi:hypothetical protein
VRSMPNAAGRLSRRRYAERGAQMGRRTGSGALTAKARPGVWRKNRRENSTHIRGCGAPRGARRVRQRMRSHRICAFRRAVPFGRVRFGRSPFGNNCSLTCLARSRGETMNRALQNVSSPGLTGRSSNMRRLCACEKKSTGGSLLCPYCFRHP